MLDSNFFSRDAEDVARDLLGKVLIVRLDNGDLRAKIVETEAYFDEKDPASRACQNGDLRETMKMEASTILVYGVHNNWLFNIVTDIIGKASAVLIRAVEPLNFEGRCNGPGLLTKSLGIDKKMHKSKIGSRISVEEGDRDFEVVNSFRIGVELLGVRDTDIFVNGVINLVNSVNRGNNSLCKELFIIVIKFSI